MKRDVSFEKILDELLNGLRPETIDVNKITKKSFRESLAIWVEKFGSCVPNSQAPISLLKLLNACYGPDFVLPPNINPKAFLGFILSQVDIIDRWDEIGNLLDGMSYSILTNAGLLNVYQDPYYRFWEDDEVLAFKGKPFNISK